MSSTFLNLDSLEKKGFITVIIKNEKIETAGWRKLEKKIDIRYENERRVVATGHVRTARYWLSHLDRQTFLIFHHNLPHIFSSQKNYRNTSFFIL